MKVVLDGRRARRGNSGCYLDNKAYFTKKGLSKRTVLHEFYHHMIGAKELEISSLEEEKDAQ